MATIRACRLTNTKAGHRKEYRLELDADTATGKWTVLREWGPIGGTLQGKSETFRHEARANAAYEMMLNAKLAKGYVIAGLSQPGTAKAKEDVKSKLKRNAPDALPAEPFLKHDAEAERFNAVADQRKEDASW